MSGPKSNVLFKAFLIAALLLALPASESLALDPFGIGQLRLNLKSDVTIPYRYLGPGHYRVAGRDLGYCMALRARRQHSYSLDSHQTKCTIDVNGDTYDYQGPKKPSLLEYLAALPKRNCDFTTGSEEELRNWILAQSDNSIDPLKIFSKSLELNRGNIWNAILAIHQTLRQDARFYNPRYFYSSNLHQSEAIFNKLIDLRGSESSKNGPGTVDHAGTWYRMWGAMLYRLSFSFGRKLGDFSITSEGCPENAPHGFNKVRSLVADFIVIGTAAMDDKVAKVLDESDTGKLRVDMGASAAASEMLDALVDPSLISKAGITPEFCDQRKYIVDGSDDEIPDESFQQMGL
jgi:hypothetical protein